jgi:hypothetical protein
MPFAFQQIAVRSQMPNNSADLMCRKSRVGGDREVVQPKLGFEIAGTNMDMRRFTAFV